MKEKKNHLWVLLLATILVIVGQNFFHDEIWSTVSFWSGIALLIAYLIWDKKSKRK